ncbi:putative bifunctional diguanylate cyclase/phosphodiesterase [Salimicrobium halophilum]|uniref:PAS domain S-box-containing protein/diguanylate cyclase (GGDEF) domain-containing protein n=1 Tax=Salimicrobium halophilum TaxID=86666 RepID=A0A1G8UC37_9BACI|nr:EAL domain-containing protein [Salimicrobium halophilum]SDJ51406.1 PAS domain S-box-containing protein/diguanylate cyclase (GGDEF) domain-containing protein [Salimicrobium halophilum]
MEAAEMKGFTDMKRDMFVVEKGIVSCVNGNLTGVYTEELNGTSLLCFLEEMGGGEFYDELREMLREGSGQKEIETSIAAPDGDAARLTIYVDVLSPEYAIGIVEDRTRKVETERELSRTLKNLEDMKYALDQSSIVAITDRQGRITYINDKFCEISGYEEEELIGGTHRIVNSGYHSREFFKEMWRTIGFGGVWKGEVRNQSKDGTYYWVDTTIVPLHNEEGKPVQYLAIRNDITDKKRNEEKIRHMAYYDHLTGLPNRRMFDKQLTAAVEEAGGTSKRFGVMFIDLDGFKYVNDTLGHLIGDRLLVEVGNRLATMIGQDGIVSRIGGDEFAILISDIDAPEQMKERAEQILRGFRHSFLIDQYELHVTGSIGVTTYPESGKDAETMMRHADLAMYRVKGAHKNHYHFFNVQTEESTGRLFDIQNGFRKALDKNQFHMVYQPRVSPDDLEIEGFEALIRWNHPEHGNIPPGEFIPLAEETGMINAIGEWVLRAVSKQLQQWKWQGLSPLPVSVNLSPNQLLQSNFVSKMLGIFRDYNIPHDWIELEITESMLIENESVVQNLLSRLREEGFRIALDDFGTGYSSLAYLRKFNVDVLKLDRSLIQGISEESNDKEIVEAVISLGKSFGMTVVAEGVEEESEMDVLRVIGVDEVQGFYFSHPVYADQINNMLMSKSMKG